MGSDSTRLTHWFRAPFVEPLKTRTCSHTFCRECIVTALGVSKFCPIDRWPLTLDDLSPADPVVRNVRIVIVYVKMRSDSPVNSKLVDELPVLCPNFDLGCLVSPQRQLLLSHLAESCPFTEVGCEDGLCDRKVPRRTAKHADHVNDPPSAADSHNSEKEVFEGVSTGLWVFGRPLTTMNSKLLPHQSALHARPRFLFRICKAINLPAPWWLFHARILYTGARGKDFVASWNLRTYPSAAMKALKGFLASTPPRFRPSPMIMRR